MLELSRDMDIPVYERSIDLTELYVADEVFACGTSSFVTPILEVDKRTVAPGPTTARLRARYMAILAGTDSHSARYLTVL
jgi:branched-chain amino acid aminotransferase